MSSSTPSFREFCLAEASGLLGEVQAFTERLAAAGEAEVRAQADAIAARAAEGASALSRELADVQRRAEAAQADVERLTCEIQQHVSERSMVESVLARATAQIDTLGATLAQTDAALVRITEQRDALASEKAGRDAEASRLVLDVQRADARLDRLHRTFSTLADSPTPTGVLGTVAAGMAGECSRVALFDVRDGQLECVHHAGFDASGDLSKVVIPLTIDSVFTAAVSTDRIQVLTMADLSDHTRVPFRGEPTYVLVLPITVHGRPRAVLYADDAGDPETGSATMAQLLMMADLLRRHAVVRLEHLSDDQSPLVELRAYAALLLEEVEYRYCAAVDAGQPHTDVVRELTSDVLCARQLYAQRANEAGAVAAGLLDARLARLVEEREGTPFGGDLAALPADEPKACAVPVDGAKAS